MPTLTWEQKMNMTSEEYAQYMLGDLKTKTDTMLTELRATADKNVADLADNKEGA